MHQLECALDGAVLAVPAVQRDEGAVEAGQFVELALDRVEGVCIDALALQRGEHARAALERDLALGGGTAEENGYFSKIRHCKNP